jgi:large subunit ribosomal protein L25
MELTGQKRQKVGKAVKSLRTEGLIPAVVFGNEIESTSLILNRMDFAKVFSKVGETGLIDLKVEGEGNYKVLVNDVQYNPVSGKIIHAGFYKPNLKEKTEVNVPVHIVGEETNALVKSGGAVVLQVINEITVRALPTDLPEAFVVDVSGLTEVGQGINVGQLAYDREKIEIMGQEDDELVIKLNTAVMEEEPTEVAEGEMTEQDKIAAMEAIAEKKPEEEAETEE